MNDRLTAYAVDNRQNSRNLTFLSKNCLHGIAGRLRPGARLDLGCPPLAGGAGSAAPAAGRRRGAGGDIPPPIAQFQPPSDKQIQGYALDKLHNGKDIVMEIRGSGTRTLHAVVPIEDLEAQMQAHSRAGLGINRLFNQVGGVQGHAAD